jgi:hypothetical protein
MFERRKDMDRLFREQLHYGSSREWLTLAMDLVAT